ncbi:RING finger protein 141-like [Ylistrum balloti]|uniref:RING finger protein 141-like n=1 Tax=Ylistrum balloti TaxID=509963 RepID=UPI002905B945|nr:RING finger protein 141-like [Ylistrum balloti]XP_060086395.1 RING finger protein 141-like [Ylistrum balloti]XP_060086396.1 RING finger protein 141-like [Ylistrum balloti]XP_060086397.1 RING finger protein 141-like [Ylistrum balloti]
MGQGKSFPDPEKTVGLVHGKLKLHLGVITKIAKLSYDDLLQSIKDINELTTAFTDHKGKQLKFSVESGTDTTFFWKHTIRICCQKINTRRNLIESSRILKLRQYIEVYCEITDQVSSLSLASDNTSMPSPLAAAGDLSASILFDEAARRSDIEEMECCICMENKSEIILACSHKFCESCIDQWNVSSRTCPICRAKVRSTDDTWVLTEKPSAVEFQSEVKDYLLGIVDNKGQPDVSH